jgi:pimeloyl-ACP methyl ester carboxylesterase
MVGGEAVPGRAGGIRGDSGSAASARLTVGARFGRAIGSFLVVALGLLAVAAAFPGSTWAWILWLAVGLVAGAVAGRVRLVWVAWLGVVAYYAMAIALDMLEAVYFWWLAGVAKTIALSLAFALGTAVGWRRDPWATAREAWRATRTAWRRLSVAVVLVALVGLVGFTGYVLTIGAGEVVSTSSPSTACATPGSRYGWAYEAINYDLADDANLVAGMDATGHCATQGAVAGSGVVSSDGVPIAGWYIPAASGVGPTGPTLLIVHGGKANKSEVLKYAPPFHDAYNLVLLDLRGSGRSGAGLATWGVREQDDLRAMIDWLVATKGPGWIGVVGNSNGAAAAVAEAGGDARVRALVLDSMHADAMTQLANVVEDENGLPGQPTAWALVTGASMKIGADLSTAYPIRTITKLGDRPVLLLHGTADKVDPPAESAERNVVAAREAGVTIGLQYCQGAGHGQVIDTCPAEWAAWATSFLAGARGG